MHLTGLGEPSEVRASGDVGLFLLSETRASSTHTDKTLESKVFS